MKLFSLLKKAPLYAITLFIMVLCAVLVLVLPPQSWSDLENRTLSTITVGPLDNTFDEAVEAYLADHFPLHDTLVQAHALLTASTGSLLQDGTLVGRGGFLLDDMPATAGSIARVNAEVVNTISSQGIPVTVLLLPPASQMLPHRRPMLYQAPDQSLVMNRVLEMLHGPTVLHSRLEMLPEEEAAQCYYRTDHHLTMKGTRYSYEQLCREWQITPAPVNEKRIENFRGAYYGRIPSPAIRPDTLTVDLPEHIRTTVDGRSRSGILDEEALKGRNKYSAIIGNAYARAELENEQAGGTLLILGDSYANALAPSLARHFHRVEIVDPRYCTDSLSGLLDELHPDRILVYQGLQTFCTSRGLVMMNDLEDE